MEFFKDDIRKILLLTPVPYQDDLHCIICRIKPSTCEPKFLFQWKILKCRMLIFSLMRIIASPCDGFENEICVIMSKDYYGTGEIHSHLNRIGIYVERSVQTTKSAYEACLRYTIIARIAPLWNQLASYLVYGRNFLLQKEPLFAVALDVVMTGKEMTIAIWPHRIHMYGVPLDDLLEEKKEQLNLLPEIEVNVGKWVHVLPSLQKAQVLSVSKQIPAQCQFISYKQLKRHWKNNYGYRLPEEEDKITFYVTVSFSNTRPLLGSNGWSGAVYTYPAQCICQCPPVVLGCINQALPLKIFLQDLSTRVPQVCDQPFAGNQVELGYALPKLHSSNERNARPSMRKLNLKDSMSHIDIFKGAKPISLKNQRLFIQSSFPSPELSEVKTLGRAVLKDSSQNIATKSYSTDFKKSDAKSTSEQVNNQTRKMEQTRYVPVFKSKLKFNSKLKHTSNQPERRSTNNVNKVLNKVKQNLQKPERSRIEKRELDKVKSRDHSLMINDENSNVKSKSVCHESIVDSSTKYAPMKECHDSAFRHERTMGDSAVPKQQQLPKQSPISQQLTFKSRGKLEELLQKNDAGNASFSSGKKNSQSTSQILYKFNELGKEQESYHSANISLLGDEGWRSEKKNDSKGNWMFDHSSAKLNDHRTNQYFQSLSSNDGTAATSSAPLIKINNTDDFMKMVKKKRLTPRSRPVVQEHLDVEALAKGGMLYKANTTTIISWLRERGVNCRVKDKKSNLIHLVKDYLGLPSNESISNYP